MRSLNLGILAHVDAGKTTLTERLLFNAGVIATLGTVDAGSTQTDFLPLERQRGITIKSAIVNFTIRDVGVNLVDTPGHPDFIAEVERILCTLGGAILVISAVEGVQAQTRILMRTLQRLRIPTILFVNKIDRMGADSERVTGGIAGRLTPSCVPMGTVSEMGTRQAAFVPFIDGEPRLVDRITNILADHDESFLEAYADGRETLDGGEAGIRLQALTKTCVAHPVYFGSALTGGGVENLAEAVVKFLPAREPNLTGPLAGSIFKIERGATGEKIAFVSIASGTLSVRDSAYLPQGEDKVKALVVFDQGRAQPVHDLPAGRIGKAWGLSHARIGDSIGSRVAGVDSRLFPPPTLETAVVSARPNERPRLHAALKALAEQDPLINLRQDDSRREMYVSLYGEVQKEVIQATLALEFGVEAQFRGTTQICVERPCGAGCGLELMGKNGNPFLATIGLRLDPGREGSGIEFRLEAALNTIPRYVFQSTELFAAAMREHVIDAARQGLFGWQVTDCIVRMTHCGYAAPATGARDYRLLTPLVMMQALKEAGTVVCEPVTDVRIDLPTDVLPGVLSLLRRLGAILAGTETQGDVSTLHCTIAADRVHEMRQMLPSLTRGEGVVETDFGGYRPLSPENPPSRARTDLNPLNRKEYLLRLSGRL